MNPQKLYSMELFHSQRMLLRKTLERHVGCQPKVTGGATRLDLRLRQTWPEGGYDKHFKIKVHREGNEL